MSNRARRRLLRKWQLRAVVEHYSRMKWELREDFETMDEWNVWHRGEYRTIWRDPLRFPGSIRPDSGLINIQIRNSPDRPLCLLDEALPYECDESPIWSELAEDFEHCGVVFYAALQGLKPLRRVNRRRFDWIAWDYERPAGKRDPAAYVLEPWPEEAEYIAPLRWAARVIRGRSHCLRQHSDNWGPLHAAETCIYWYCPFWIERGARLHPLTDSETLYLMAAYYAFEAAENLVRYAELVRDEAEDAGIGPEDYDALERLRGRIAATERIERRYYGGFLADARELLALAEKETERETGDAKVRNERNRLEAERQATIERERIEARERQRAQLSKGPPARKQQQEVPRPQEEALATIVKKIGTRETKLVWAAIERAANGREVIAGVRFLSTAGELIEWESESDEVEFPSLKASSLAGTLTRISKKTWWNRFFNEMD